MRDKVLKAVDTAFLAAGDIVETATLYSQEPTGFNWATGSVVSAAPVSTQVQFIDLSTTLEENSSWSKKVLVKTTDIVLSLYSSIVISGVTYRFQVLEATIGVSTLGLRGTS